MNKELLGELKHKRKATEDKGKDSSWEKYRDIVQAIREDNGKDKGKIMP